MQVVIYSSMDVDREMIEGHWFTTIGMSPHAVYNTLWMAYLEHDWHPVKITVFRLTPTSSRPGYTYQES